MTQKDIENLDDRLKMIKKDCLREWNTNGAFVMIPIDHYESLKKEVGYLALIIVEEIQKGSIKVIS